MKSAPVDDSLASLADRAALPQDTRTEREVFIEFITPLCSGCWSATLRPFDLTGYRALIEVCATWQARPLPDILVVVLAKLAELAESNARRDEIALQFAFGMIGANTVAIVV